MDPINRRDGVRVEVNNDITGVIFNNDNEKISCGNFAINLAGLQLEQPIQSLESTISICLSHSDGTELTLDCQIIASNTNSSTLKFTPLTQQQRTTLSNMLRLQQAC